MITLEFEPHSFYLNDKSATKLKNPMKLRTMKNNVVHIYIRKECFKTKACATSFHIDFCVAYMLCCFYWFRFFLFAASIAKFPEATRFYEMSVIFLYSKKEKKEKHPYSAASGSWCQNQHFVAKENGRHNVNKLSEEIAEKSTNASFQHQFMPSPFSYSFHRAGVYS